MRIPWTLLLSVPVLVIGHACAGDPPAAEPVAVRAESSSLPRAVAVEPQRAAQDPAVAPRPAQDDLDAVRLTLTQPGPEAAEARQACIERVLARRDLAAHAVLQEFTGPDAQHAQVRQEILVALARRLGAGLDPFVVAVDGGTRDEVAASWLMALVPHWAGDADRSERLAPEPVRDLARTCLVRLPQSTLVQGLAALCGRSSDTATRIAAMRAAADSQSLLLAPVLALYVGKTTAQDGTRDEERIRSCAQRCLQNLTFVVEPFTDEVSFELWRERNATRRYLDLAEAAARSAPAQREIEMRAFEQGLRQLNADLVAALMRTRNGVDWPRIQDIVTADSPVGTTDACLARLLEILRQEMPGESQPQPRLVFVKALLAQLRGTEERLVDRRALMLEVCAMLTRPADTDLATEVTELLLPQLDSMFAALRLAALRGLARFPSVPVRAAVVRTCRSALAQQGPDALDTARTALQTLGSRGEPPWVAPLTEDADHQDWLSLLREALHGASTTNELRTGALAMAAMKDGKGARLPQAFDALLAIAKDASLPFELRTSCLVQLQDFQSSGERFVAFVTEICNLLADADKEVRLFAANLIARMPEQGESRRRDWIRTALDAVRDRLLAEPDAGVLRALTAVVITCAEAPGSPEQAMGPLLAALGELKPPVAPEQQFRIEPILQAVTTIAASPQAGPGNWLLACDELLRHERRRMVRHVLSSQRAATLADKVKDPDPVVAEGARRAVLVIVQAALLKPATEPWSTLREEAVEVRSALLALDQLQVSTDAPAMRLLRLGVFAALGQPQEVFGAASRYLAPTDVPNKDAEPLSPRDKDAVRLFAAEAAVALGKREDGKRLLEERDRALDQDPATLDVVEKLGQSFLDLNDEPSLRQAAPLLNRVLQATPATDARYRARLLAWARAAVRLGTDERTQAAALLQSKADLFAAADCPAEQRAEFDRLRAKPQ